MSKFLALTRSFALAATIAAVSASFASAQVLKTPELKKLIGTASTSQDHERIAKHFDAKAAQLDADAVEHEDLAAAYARNPSSHEQKHPMSGPTAAHCKVFAEKCREAAKEARSLAAEHRAMGKEVTK